MSVRDSKTNFSAGAFSMALFAVGVLLWGCGGSGCGGGNCPPVGCPTPKEGLGDNILGHVAYGDTPTSDTIVASVGSDGDIYFQLTGSDPSQGPNWTSWADYFKLHPFGLHDWDQAVITFYPDASQSCDTSTTNYYLQDNKLSLQVTWDESDVVWEAGEHDMVMTLDDPGTQSLIGLPGCYSVEDPDKTITVKVHLWDAKLDAPTSPLRGDDVTYEMKHDDLPTSYVLGYHWDSDWGIGSAHEPASGLANLKTWDGIVVTTTTVTGTVRVQPPFMTAFNVTDSTTTQVIRRDWHLDPPTSFSEDYDTNWEAVRTNGNPIYPTLSPIWCDGTDMITHQLGELHNINSGGRPFMFFPNFASGDAIIFSLVPTDEITTGPNKGLFYVVDANFQYNLGSAINKWIRPNTNSIPGTTTTTTWYVENALISCFSATSDVAGFLNACKTHEGYGNATAANGFGNGHFAQFVAFAAQPQYDIRYQLEDLWNASETNLQLDIVHVMSDVQDADVTAADVDHTYVNSNWKNTNGNNPEVIIRGWTNIANDPYSGGIPGAWGTTSSDCNCGRNGSDLIP